MHALCLMLLKAFTICQKFWSGFQYLYEKNLDGFSQYGQVKGVLAGALFSCTPAEFFSLQFHILGPLIPHLL